ncbi:hypothetical protein ACILFN_10970 [Capnocytophaga canimorsus]|uniref:hypothetical protein n=1 Tax=Capnocytophaga canimorsus TaxID=28188 RepID=UPI0037D94E0F
MNKNVSLVVFGTFGNPNGFKQSVIGNTKNIKAFDLNPNAMQLFEGVEKFYALRKEISDGNRVISFVKYSYAAEQGSSRGGTFVGAAVIFANGLEDGGKILTCLDQLHHNLVSSPRNVQDGVIMVKHSEEFQLDAPDNYLSLSASDDLISDIDFSENKRNALFYTSLSKVQTLFEKALDLLNIYDIIYFTDNQEVANYTIKKGLYDFKQEVGDKKELTALCQKVEEQKMRKQNAELSKLLSFIEELEKEKVTVYEKYSDVISENTKVHQENHKRIEKSKLDLNKLKKTYDECIQGLESESQKLKDGRLKQVDLHKVQTEIRNKLEHFSSNKKNIPKVANLQPVSSLNVKAPTKKVSSPFQNGQKDESPIYGVAEPKNDHFFLKKKVIFVVSFVLLVMALTIIALFFTRNYNEQSNDNSSSKGTKGVVDIDSRIIQGSNSLLVDKYLSDDDTQNTIKKQFPKEKLPMSISKIVKGIYNANPKDIGTPFAGKEKEYAKLLIQENKHLFSPQDKDTFLTNTEGMKIPIPKKVK